MIKKIVFLNITFLMLMGCSSKQPVQKDPDRLHNNNPAMYQKFLGKKADDELDKEMNKY